MLSFSHFAFENDGMKSSKRQVTFLSSIFLLKCKNHRVILHFCLLKTQAGKSDDYPSVIVLKGCVEICKYQLFSISPSCFNLFETCFNLFLKLNQISNE